MRGAIASVEIYAHREGESVRRLTLVVSTPERSVDSAGWVCRVALADLHRPESIEGPDSVAVLTAALARGREWLAQLQLEGAVLYRDRDTRQRYHLDLFGADRS